jgi:hypothetical protein
MDAERRKHRGGEDEEREIALGGSSGTKHGSLHRLGLDRACTPRRREDFPAGFGNEAWRSMSLRCEAVTLQRSAGASTLPEL